MLRASALLHNMAKQRVATVRAVTRAVAIVRLDVTNQPNGVVKIESLNTLEPLNDKLIKKTELGQRFFTVHTKCFTPFVAITFCRCYCFFYLACRCRKKSMFIMDLDGDAMNVNKNE